MQPVAGCIHLLRHAGYVKSSKKSTKAVGMFWLNSAFGAGLRKALQPLVPIALNHPYSVSIHYTIYQQSIGQRQNVVAGGETVRGTNWISFWKKPASWWRWKLRRAVR